MIIYSGILLPNKEIIKLNSSDVIIYLCNILKNSSPEDLYCYKKYKETHFFSYERSIIEYFVSFKNYVIICNNFVYYQENCTYNLEEYINMGYRLKELYPMIYKNGHISVNPDDNNYLNRIKKNKSI